MGSLQQELLVPWPFSWARRFFVKPSPQAYLVKHNGSNLANSWQTCLAVGL